MTMVHVYVDDMRDNPGGFIHFRTVNDTMNYIRKMYKSGVNEFYLDLDHDAGDYNTPENGGDYINILKNLEDMRYGGHIRHMNVQVHIHTGNIVGRQNMRAIINANRNWMKEV